MESRVGTAFGKYNIISLLGKGGMGEVYEAYDTDKNRTVALKILADALSNDDTFRKRFQRESHAAAVLQEPHVIPIHDWGEIDGRLYIDMRLVHGQTLDEMIAKGPLEPSRAVAIIGQIGSALDAAHAEGLIASRYQAAQHHRHPGRFRVPRRLRDRRGAGRHPADDRGHSHRNHQLHGA